MVQPISAIQRADKADAVRPTVLVVEDEALIRVLVGDTLRHAGCAVIEAATADEAMSTLCADAALDVLVTDVRLPGTVDGLRLASWVRRRRPELKVIVTSGDALAHRAAAVADAFLPKPFALDQLVGHVRALADGAWARQPGRPSPAV